MKFQNCILKNFVTGAQTDARKHGRTSRKQYAPFNFSKVGGIKILQLCLRTLLNINFPGKCLYFVRIVRFCTFKYLHTGVKF